MKTIKDIEHLEGVNVLVRADFNVPIKDGVVADDFRIKAAFPTIDYLTERGAKVILISHIESNDKTAAPESNTLAPIAEYFAKIGRPVSFVTDYRTVPELLENKIQNGQCVLLENLRFAPGEQANDPSFAEQVASLGDIYVNEAFPVSHRAHASVVGIPKLLPHYAGLQFEKEVTNLSKAFAPEHPFLFILGGAKFDTKLPLINRFTQIADLIFMGGALGNDGLKARGINVGASKISSGATSVSDIVVSPKILLPLDAVIQDRTVKDIEVLGADDSILDPGPKTLDLLKEKIVAARFILWNGPLGPYEVGYVEGTEAVARIIGEATVAGVGSVTSIVGGGDTLAAISKLGIQDQFTFVSSGGGAMLDFLAEGTLVGIEALG
jgi:phosphoglycerate kinase